VVVKNGANSPPEGEKGHDSGAGGVRIDIGRKGEKGNTMKQLFLLFLLFFTTDSHSSGIASNTNSAPCTNNTLETYSGNSNLSADWQPNEIKLRWYNNNTLMDVQASANTCTYDGTLAVPQTAPTRTGYTFAGWTVRPEIDFAATIPVNEGGIEAYSKDVHNNADHCWRRINENRQYPGCNSDENFSELQQHEWKVIYNHGTLYGMARCSEIEGTIFRPGTPTNVYGDYCWCKATGYRATSANTIKSPNVALAWVYSDDYSSYGIGACGPNCARNCANRYFSSGVLQTLFTPANN